MKKYSVMLVAFLGLFLSANAAMIDLGYTGGQPADPISEMNRLNGQIGKYNVNASPDLPLATMPLWGGTQTQVGEELKGITLDLSGFEGYLLFKYGPVDRFYYLNDNVQSVSPWGIGSVTSDGNGLYTFTSDVYNFGSFSESAFALPPAAGLSHYTVFTPVPEPATWLAGACLLLPFGISTMRIFRPNLLRN